MLKNETTTKKSSCQVWSECAGEPSGGVVSQILAENPAPAFGRRPAGRWAVVAGEASHSWLLGHVNQALEHS